VLAALDAPARATIAVLAYGLVMYVAATVLAIDSTTTTIRRRHCGATWPSARRRSLSSSGK